MTVAPGTQLGPYVIEAPLGAGGMGEVWKARDTRLNRFVAIKFATEQFSQRFEREARAVAALNHPHICTLHDVGPNYLVMELVDGQALAGPLPLDRALLFATQILSALDAAHRKGITHRDLKPANILVTRQGVKLLDFGVAKVSTDSELAGSVEWDQTRELSESPTMARPLTAEHTILGTVSYMSPEQAQGKPADARSDIFSFGLVLYEMLTGRRAFDGSNPASVIAAILERDAPSVVGIAPPALDRVLQKCLAKDPDERFQTARDLKSALEWTADAVPSVAPVRDTVRRWPAIAAAALALLSAIAVAGWWRAATASNPEPTPTVPLDLFLGAPLSPANVGADAVLSPDETRIVFVSQVEGGVSRLLTRRLDQPEAVALPRTDGAQGPFFSPDGQWVGFFADGKLKKIRLNGADPLVLCDAPAGRGGSWSETGNIIAALDTRGGLSQVSADGGTSVTLTTVLPGDNSHRWPQVLPGGTHVLFAIGHGFANFEESDVAVLSLTDRHIKKLLPRTGMFPRYARGMLTYVTKGRLVAVPFDLEALEVRGPAKPVLEEVSNDTNYGFAQVDFSAGGMLLYRRGRTEGLRTVEWMDASGKTVPVTSEPAYYLFPRVSPDGARLIWTANEGANADVWIHDVQRGGRARLTSGTGVNSYPVWSPDGQVVVFSAGGGGIYWTRADGAGKPLPLTETTTRIQLPYSFTPDGKRLVYSEHEEGRARIQTLPIQYEAGQLRSGRPELFLQTSSGSAPFPAFSPDGRWLAYADSESGRYEVYVRAFPDRGTKWQISNSGGTMPLWSRNGRELFYRTEDSQVMLVDYSIRGNAFVAQKPRVWSERRLANTGLAPNLDLASGGDRLLALIPAGSSEPRGPQGHITVVLNPFETRRR